MAVFDKSFRVNFPDTIKVESHQHNAPTMESVRLLREMEAAALASVVGTLVVDNPLKWTVIAYKEADPAGVTAVPTFVLNGETYKCAPVHMSHLEWAAVAKWKLDNHRDALVKSLMERLTSVIADKLYNKVAQALVQAMQAHER